MQLQNPIAGLRGAWRGKGLVRVSLLLVAAAAVAAVASAFGIAHDYGYLHASILTGSPGGQYHALATRLADRAKREHGTLMVIPTAGSIENVSRLANARGGCAEKFASSKTARRCRLMLGSSSLVGSPNRNPFCFSEDRAMPFTLLPICAARRSGSARKARARRT